MLHSESFDELIEYADIMNLLHDLPKLDELITFACIINGNIDEPYYVSKFIGYLLYKSIINNDSVVASLQHFKYCGLHSVVKLLEFAYRNNNLDVILSNTWIINNNYRIFHYVDDNISGLILQYIIENYPRFDIENVWHHIYHFIGNEYSHYKLEVIQKCIDIQLPQLSEQMLSLYHQCQDFKVRNQIIDLMMSHGIKPPMELIKSAFHWRSKSTIELFVKHNIDIKQIFNTKPVSKWSQEMICLTTQLGVDMETYLHIVSD